MPNNTQPSTITIPRTINSASTKLAELGGLVTATEWHKAAITAAFIDPGVGQGRRTSADSSGGLESASAFAARAASSA